MARLLIYAKNNVSQDQNGCFNKGDIVKAFPDTHIFGRKEALPNFVVIDVPAALSQVSQYAENLIKPIKINILSADKNKGEYTLEVSSALASVESAQGLTVANVSRFLSRWNCTINAFSENLVNFTFSAWPALQSSGFWDGDPSALDFTLDKYNKGTGMATATVSNIPSKLVPAAGKLIIKKGGTVTGATTSSITFDLLADIVNQTFIDEMKKRIMTAIKRQYQVDSSTVDAAVAAGGTIAMSNAAALAAIRNKADG